ncbi:DUF1579 domain-containing protein [Limnoglobus roseus]|uniref:DUF1579 domain-containing protein n=1 Tax=Limnoglobus roseus TaxID=2598579 RepID=A0A5C1AHL8_9BACT|nr:DUF1579 domain-containing protein [Limnoglobus roseus]QEL17667.1 hypothetical protein PX52LOC_04665 [Limnoglobus roseus]
MFKFVLVGLMTVLVAGFAPAEDAPKPPAPQKEHGWLKQLEGEWACESEAVFEPGKPAVKCRGTETVKSLGGFWTVGEMKGEFMGTPVTGIMTVGYDAKKGKYVGTWVCSMDGHLCTYEGSVDAAGKVLTLETEGVHPATGKAVKMKDVLEMKDKDTRVMTSSAQGADGKWETFMTMTAKRKK